MGKQLSKVERPNANVINDVKVIEREVNLSKIEICLLVMTVFIILKFVIKAYSIHNKMIKKKYTVRNTIEKI